MKKILVTGSSGYIGGHLVQLLKKNTDYEIHGLDRQTPEHVSPHFHHKIDIRHLRNDLMPKFDTVIHLAGSVNVGASVRDPWKYYETNIVGTGNVLDLQYNNFIFASTGAAAGLGSPYGISKRAAEDVVRQICQERERSYTIFRFYNVIGSDGIPPTNPDGLMMNLIKARNTGEFQLNGIDYRTRDGTCLRDYVHVNEICHALIKAIDRPANNLENLGHGTGQTVQEMINMFKRVNNCDFNIRVGPRRSGDLEASVLDHPSDYLTRLYSLEDLLKI
jgi:UDP-glucose 4-epimerase